MISPDPESVDIVAQTIPATEEHLPITIRTTAYLKYFIRNRAVTIPMRARKRTSGGIWNTSPKASSIFR